MPVSRIRERRRHLPLDDSGLDRFRPWTHVPIGQERHRRDLSRAMACLTVLLQNRQNMLVEGDGSSRRILLRHGMDRSRHGSQHQQDHARKCELSQTHSASRTMSDDRRYYSPSEEHDGYSQRPVPTENSVLAAGAQRIGDCASAVWAARGATRHGVSTKSSSRPVAEWPFVNFSR